MIGEVLTQLVDVGRHVLMRRRRVDGMLDLDRIVAESARIAHQAGNSNSIELDERGRAKPKFTRINRVFDHREHAIGLSQAILGL